MTKNERPIVTQKSQDIHVLTAFISASFPSPPPARGFIKFKSTNPRPAIPSVYQCRVDGMVVEAVRCIRFVRHPRESLATLPDLDVLDGTGH